MKQFLQKVMILAVFCCLTSVAAFSQGTVTGKVFDDRGETLPGANVFIKGTSLGTITDFDGNFKINKVPAGTKTLVYSFVGFDDFEKEINVQDGSTVDVGEVNMVSNVLGLDEIEIVASRSTVESPFTFSDVKKKDIEMNLGSRDLPLAMNVTPSFYSTNSGGGAGDARLNVRGFNQRNVAIMINGVPVNDMENGWVYWSNWDGLGDAAHSIQLQRGMSPVNLAVPSIGGTMNIITDPAGKAQSTAFKQEFGSWNFKKTTISYNSGLIDDKLAISGTLVRKTGDGFYQGLYTDAWAYYLGLSYQLNENNKLEAFLIGAPQKHGQNLYMQNIGRYDKDFALSLNDYDVRALDRYKTAGRDFNQNYGGVSPTYTDKQYSGTYSEGIRDRSGENYMMERENFFHKPQFNLNWHHTFSDKIQMTTIGYWSGGRGGGTGTAGSVSFDRSFAGFGQPNWNAEIAQNRANLDSAGFRSSTGILRNSRNNQYTIGLISKMFIDINEKLKVQFGIDWRTAEIEHYREVRDLLGGDYYLFTGDEFATENWQRRKGLGDKMDYDYTNTVDWIGFYGQGTYKINNLTTFLMAGFTSTKYTHTNHFEMGTDGGELKIEPDALTGYQIKTGASYIFNRDFNIYGNFGFISKNPNFDRVIDDESFILLADPENQTFSSIELGLNYKIGSNVAFNVNYYNTLWSNRTQKEEVTIVSPTETREFFTLLTGIEQRNSGFEVEGSYQPTPRLRFDAAMSFSNWEFVNDPRVIATENDAVGNVIARNEGTALIKGLKEGDAPQNQFTVAATFNPTKNFTFKLDYRFYSKFYSAYNPAGRVIFDSDYPTIAEIPNITDPDQLEEVEDLQGKVLEIEERNSTWEVPSYAVVDFHVNYIVPMKETAGFKLELFAHVFNLFNKVYIQDAIDNSRFNSYDGDHDADDAEVFLGLPRNYNMGLRIKF